MKPSSMLKVVRAGSRACVLLAVAALTIGTLQAGSISPDSGSPVGPFTFTNWGPTAYEVKLNFNAGGSLNSCDVLVDTGGPISQCVASGNSVVIYWKDAYSGIGTGEKVTFSMDSWYGATFTSGNWRSKTGASLDPVTSTTSEPSAAILLGTTLIVGLPLLRRRLQSRKR